MRFLRYLLRRIVGIAAVMIGVSVITFAISHVIPADPAAAALGDHATTEQIAEFRAELESLLNAKEGKPVKAKKSAN